MVGTSPLNRILTFPLIKLEYTRPFWDSYSYPYHHSSTVRSLQIIHPNSSSFLLWKIFMEMVLCIPGTQTSHILQVQPPFKDRQPPKSSSNKAETQYIYIIYIYQPFAIQECMKVSYHYLSGIVLSYLPCFLWRRYIYIYIYRHNHIHTHVSLHLYVQTCEYTNIYICYVNINRHIHIYTHIHTQIQTYV